ncbi:MAG TPA: VanZ family protein [Candidatus Binataceae bacterium]|nr:VanZ family protein [Candidatus Binataceae bacterium]
MSNASSARAQLTLWAPVLIWGAVIFTLSTSAFSAANTARIIDPLLAWLVPGISPISVEVGHVLIRKCAHFTEYAILFWLLIRGPMAGRPYLALGLCVLYALSDEGHQIFVPGRTASLYDVALDSTGAAFGGFVRSAVVEILL